MFPGITEASAYQAMTKGLPEREVAALPTCTRSTASKGDDLAPVGRAGTRAR